MLATDTPTMEIVDEDERRFLVLGIDPDVYRSPSVRIEQAYLEDVRLRVTEGKTAVVSQKTGRGIRRIEKNLKNADLETVRFQMDCARLKLAKRRFLKDGWHVDVYEGPLQGLVMAEFEFPKGTTDFALKLPDWIYKSIEVTDSVTNHHLARLAYDLSGETIDRPVREMLVSLLPYIVVTGGPCSGKSELMKELKLDRKDVLHCVPEVATIIIELVGAKPPLGDVVKMKQYQRLIYRAQIGFEEVSNIQAVIDGKRALLLDRGAVDGAAYVPRGMSEFAHICETTESDLFGRYKHVICLEVAPERIYELKKTNNPARRETYPEAVALGQNIRKVWQGHPGFTFVPNDGDDWGKKRDKALEALRLALENC